MQAMNYFGQEGAQLEWESPGSACAFDFLDLNIQINRDGTLTTSTFQKPMNLWPTFSDPLPLHNHQVYSMGLSTAPYIHCSGKIRSKTRSEHSPSSFFSDVSDPYR
jgi:hypothetical protein